MGYSKDAIKGISWLGGLRIFTRILSLVRQVILARLLTPGQFGLFAIVGIVLSLTEVFTETGINIFLIQKKENKESIDTYVNTAWVVSICRGIIIAFIIVISAPFISSFFNSKELYPLLILGSTVPLIRGFINPSVVKFIKELRFNKEFSYRTSIFFVESFISIILAYILQSPASLVWGLIAGALFEVILSFRLVSPIPAFVFDKKLFKEILTKGKWLTLSGIFNYLYHHGDDIVVGKILGAVPLGLYDRAYAISMLPISEVSDTFSKATFPLYVKITEDIERFKYAYIKSLVSMSFIVVPIGMVFFFFPEQIITLILGPRWLSASQALQVLAIFGAVRAIASSIIAPIYALQKQEMVTVITFVSLVGMALTIIPFVQNWGIVGAGYSALFGTLLSLPVILFFLRSIFKKNGRLIASTK